MHHTATALKAAVESSREDQLYWAKSLKMDPSQFNKYCNGTERVGPKALERLLEVFPQEAQSSILAAYLRDQVPQGAEQLVRVEARLMVVQEAPENLLEGLDAERADLMRFVRARIKERHIFDLLDRLRRALTRERSLG